MKWGRQKPLEIRRNKRCICCSLSSLTVCDLQLGLGQDAACHRQRLADVVAGVGPLHRRDGEVAAGGHREAAVGLLGLVGKEEVLREKEKQTESSAITWQQTLIFTSKLPGDSALRFRWRRWLEPSQRLRCLGSAATFRSTSTSSGPPRATFKSHSDHPSPHPPRPPQPRWNRTYVTEETLGEDHNQSCMFQSKYSTLKGGLRDSSR